MTCDQSQPTFKMCSAESSLTLRRPSLSCKRPYEYLCDPQCRGPFWPPPLLMKSCSLRPMLAAFRLVALLAFCGPAGAFDAKVASPKFFERSIRPVFSNYCFRCHSTEKKKGDMDLE